MDDSALTSLKAAYQAAPSKDLAKVIVLELIDKGDHQSIDRYVDNLGAEMNLNDGSKIFIAVFNHCNAETQRKLLKQFDDDALKSLLQHCVDSGASSVTAKAYALRKQVDKNFYDERLDPAEGTSKNKPSEGPKLRVVEKKDMADVTELARYAERTSTFADVVGLEHIKKQINKRIILPFQKPSLFQRFKKKIGGGVLLFGPPGCGKTLLARATAGECKANFFNIEISDVLDMYIGESEQKLHAIFEKARASTPAVLFFDELEALAGKREHSRNSASANVVSQFLAELDGFNQNNGGVLVLASTNVPWSIDPAFLRPGRFDRMFFVPPPDKIARASILRHHMQGRPTDEDINFDALAAKTPGYSGADLANLVEMAADEAIDHAIETGSESGIINSHFKGALGECRATTSEWLTTARNYARYANDGGRYDEVIEFMKRHGK